MFLTINFQNYECTLPMKATFCFYCLLQPKQLFALIKTLIILIWLEPATFISTFFFWCSIRVICLFFFVFESVPALTILGHYLKLHQFFREYNSKHLRFKCLAHAFYIQILISKYDRLLWPTPLHFNLDQAFKLRLLELKVNFIYY